VRSPRGDFTRQAAAYARARPTYPAALVDALAGHAGVSPGDLVADIGAGTGLFTCLLARRGFTVSAVEPNEAMSRQAPDLPNTTWIDGSFERTRLPEASQRWAVAAQAFHWADPARALPEMRRILEPGGCFTAVWNDRPKGGSEVLQATIAIIREEDPAVVSGYRDRDWTDVLTSTGDFTDVVRHRDEHVQVLDCRDYPLLWLSRNRLYAALGEEGCRRVADRIAAYLAEQDLREVEIPYATHAWTARRV